MIKFSYTNKDGVTGYGFGLSERNVNLLKEGKPIVIDLAQMGGQGEIFIFYGKTEQAMALEIASYIGPDTKVNIDPRLKD